MALPYIYILVDFHDPDKPNIRHRRVRADNEEHACIVGRKAMHAPPKLPPGQIDAAFRSLE